jgi:tetratricopeptide (TPR) repeat protein
MDTKEAKELAHEFFLKAYKLQMEHNLERAIELYKMSIEVFDTPEARTFLGWTYSFMEDYDAAIDECRKAIQLDPDFGNPYNDIGSYYIQLGQFSKAIPFLRKATIAKRYDARHYPHYNLGRIFERQGLWLEAIAEYKKAVDIEPNYQLAVVAHTKLKSRLN